MGPFTLMDYIGNDVNYAVTCSVFEAFYYDPRFKPSFTQKRYSEAGYLGRKSGKGYFDYEKEELNPKPTKDKELGKAIVERILAMLINEAIDAVFMQVASVEDVDLAMTKGVGAHLTNDQKRAHLADIKREHLIDEILTQEVLPPDNNY